MFNQHWLPRQPSKILSSQPQSLSQSSSLVFSPVCSTCSFLVPLYRYPHKYTQDSLTFIRPPNTLRRSRVSTSCSFLHLLPYLMSLTFLSFQDPPTLSFFPVLPNILGPPEKKELPLDSSRFHFSSPFTLFFNLTLQRAYFNST